jgi:hypothetical protein
MAEVCQPRLTLLPPYVRLELRPRLRCSLRLGFGNPIQVAHDGFSRGAMEKMKFQIFPSAFPTLK